MRAALFEQFAQPLSIVDVPDPQPPADGVVIAVRANGICRSDWHGWIGHDRDVRLPHVPGHELAGVVAEVGPAVRGWRVGDRVTVPFACGCGHCRECNAGNQHICDNYFQPGFTAWGSFAEYVAIPHADVNLVRLPDDLDFVAAASLGCRFTTAFRAVVDQGRARAGEWVAVHGCGGVGLSAVMVAAAAGALPIAVDIDDARLARARTFGAVHTINARNTPKVVAAIRDLTAGGAQLSLDALGSTETAINSIRCLRKRGRHVQVGLMLAEHARPAVPLALLHAHEVELLGSHGMPAWAYAPLLALITAGRLQPQKLIEQTLTLAEGAVWLTEMDRFPGSGVAVIDRF